MADAVSFLLQPVLHEFNICLSINNRREMSQSEHKINQLKIQLKKGA